MPVFIFIAVFAIGALLAISYRTYQSDKEEKASKETAGQSREPELSEAEDQPEEIINLVDYFSGPEKEASSSPVESGDVEYDKLCDFKLGQGHLDDCQAALNGALQEGAQWAVFCIDIDRFRFINSLRGVSLGDYALTHMAHEMEAIFPDNAVLSRKSADHFTACFPINDVADLDNYCDRLRRGADRIRGDINVKGGLHLCIGAALTSTDGYDVDILLAKANVARHCMKSSKNESYLLYNESMVTSLLYGESALDDYNDFQYGDELVLYFQPQSDIFKSIIAASQLLVRWTCINAIAKDQPVISETGKIPTNGGKALYQGCREIGRWRKAGKELLPIQVYLPIQDFYKSDIDELFVKVMSEFQLEPSLIIPVVESASIRIHPATAVLQLKKLTDLGIKVAVDAITATVPNFDHLAGMPLHYVKVPRGLTSNIERKPERQEFLQRIHQNITAFGLTPVYEGIEDVTRMKTIREMGGLLVEGRYAGRAVLSDDFSRILQEYVQKQKNFDTTVILENDDFAKGDYKLL